MPITLSTDSEFVRRHVGPSDAEIAEMLDALGVDSVDQLIDQTVPAGIRFKRPLQIPTAMSEAALLREAASRASENKIFRSYLGMGYYGTITPAPIQRNILENPSWYTQYTPYQAEIAQGRLEALLNYQTMVLDLTGLEVANASLLDEGTAAAEAMMMLHRNQKRDVRDRFVVADHVHPQTIAVLQMRAEPIGVVVDVAPVDALPIGADVFGVLTQYPASDGKVVDLQPIATATHEVGAHLVVASDLLALTLLEAPGHLGADVVVGSSQRFGVPMGYGGPHAAFFACTEAFKRQIPGRIIGVTIDADEEPALRMALQTREQHIRRDRATSNICTAQVLLAVMAGMYAVYHGAKGLKRIATRVHDRTRVLAESLASGGHHIVHDVYFDTIRVRPEGTTAADIRTRALDHGINLRYFDNGDVGVSLDETVEQQDLFDVAALFGVTPAGVSAAAAQLTSGYTGLCERTSTYLTHETFVRYQSETELMRYMHRLSSKDLSLTTSMIPLGSCTMKLNAAVELMPVTMPGFNQLHPFVPADQAQGYARIITELHDWLAEITGFDAVSMQPNSGASGEYAGLLVIRAYHQAHAAAHRNVCLIPTSAHGTNPASAVMAGMKVVPVKSDERGNVDVADLEAKAAQHAEHLAALMVTYPSTHGVFESSIQHICDVVHQHGGLVYMDGANLNAQVGLCRPADIGADVCHMNLHKTFAIPHGGGGPGMGPIGVTAALAPFLPGHPEADCGGSAAIGPVAAAPYGSASILLISWAYIAMLGAEGVKRASEIAILSANYMAERLKDAYPILFRGEQGRVAHEFILDLREVKASCGISEVDVAKRLMDYGYHAPTMSWPVVGTMMVEPTESESKQELDRFCDAMLSIGEEIRQVRMGILDEHRNPLKNAPHTAKMVLSDTWEEPYTREQAAYPMSSLKSHKFWPTVRRVNDAHGDRNLVCSCLPMEAYGES